jgi:hypothetical protein
MTHLVWLRVGNGLRLHAFERTSAGHSQTASCGKSIMKWGFVTSNPTLPACADCVRAVDRMDES